MSYAIHAFAVPASALEKAAGSKNRRLLKKVVAKSRDDFEEIDEFEEEVASVEQTLSDIVNGADRDEDAGFKYGYALKFLCEHLGRMLPNDAWCSIRGDWIDTVDEALDDAGVDRDLIRIADHLVGRGAPISIPPIDDFPAIGYLSESECGRAAAELTPERLATVEDEDTRMSIGQVSSWIDQCIRKHCDLVCFYH